MRLLIDTHTLFWYTEADSLLSKNALRLIDDPSNKIFVSMVTFYEAAIKINIGKLQLGKSIQEFYQQTVVANIEVLPISPNYLAAFAELPSFANHKDPFDRLIIATALSENVAIITADTKFGLYEELVSIIW